MVLITDALPHSWTSSKAIGLFLSAVNVEPPKGAGEFPSSLPICRDMGHICGTF